jgi:hypothetical protein
LWTQTILLAVGWTFAILSINMKGEIVKWLHALFNVLQVIKTFIVRYFQFHSTTLASFSNVRIVYWNKTEMISTLKSIQIIYYIWSIANLLAVMVDYRKLLISASCCCLQ